ncbi:hypothetical protein GCM10022226_30600 [Sphaerisporangium flaviroseum]|uniref:Uncharacterized protein n=1 Tax=Sphaerisporangium flaviroseum TaxID=509199 RepID=A0ABP7HZV0_9ACTN
MRTIGQWAGHPENMDDERDTRNTGDRNAGGRTAVIHRNKWLFLNGLPHTGKSLRPLIEERTRVRLPANGGAAARREASFMSRAFIAEYGIHSPETGVRSSDAPASCRTGFRNGVSK